MPTKSLSQHRFIRAAADRGEAWAKKWVSKYEHGKSLGDLPEKVEKKEAMLSLYVRAFNKAAEAAGFSQHLLKNYNPEALQRRAFQLDPNKASVWTGKFDPTTAANIVAQRSTKA